MPHNGLGFFSKLFAVTVLLNPVRRNPSPSTQHFHSQERMNHETHLHCCQKNNKDLSGSPNHPKDDASSGTPKGRIGARRAGRIGKKNNFSLSCPCASQGSCRAAILVILNRKANCNRISRILIFLRHPGTEHYLFRTTPIFGHFFL